MFVRLVNRKGFFKEHKIEKLVPIVRTSIPFYKDVDDCDILFDTVDKKEIAFWFVKRTPESRDFEAIYKEEN